MEMLSQHISRNSEWTLKPSALNLIRICRVLIDILNSSDRVGCGALAAWTRLALIPNEMFSEWRLGPDIFTDLVMHIVPSKSTRRMIPHQRSCMEFSTKVVTI